MNLTTTFEPASDGWFHIAPHGTFPHPNGAQQVLDAEACEAMTRTFAEEARQPNFPGLLVDFDHFSHDPAQPSAAAGWVTGLEPRTDGLYAQVRWSDLGHAAVTGGRYSYLMQSLTPNDLFVVTGLNAPISVSSGTLVWLEIDFASDGATVTAAAIGSGSSGWTGFPTPFTYTGDSSPILATAFLLIGYIAAASSTLDGTAISGGPSGAPVTGKIIQCVTQHLLLRAGVFDGQAMIFPFPHHGPYVTS